MKPSRSVPMQIFYHCHSEVQNQSICVSVCPIHPLSTNFKQHTIRGCSQTTFTRGGGYVVKNFSFLSTITRLENVNVGGHVVKKRQKLVNVVCEQPLRSMDINCKRLYSVKVFPKALFNTCQMASKSYFSCLLNFSSL